jgi:hypothetical protein
LTGDGRALSNTGTGETMSTNRVIPNQKTLLTGSAVAICAIGFLTVPGPAQAHPPLPLAPPSVCSVAGDIFRVFRSDGQLLTVDANGATFGPKANLYITADNPTELDTNHGTATGNVHNFGMDFTFSGGGAATSYHGEVVTDGSVDGWVVGSKPQINWTAKPGSVICTAETVGGTATVNKADDIYNQPDGNGQPYQADGKNIFVPQGQVQLATNPQRCDNWCHIVTNKVTGDAWIYADEGYVTVP